MFICDKTEDVDPIICTLATCKQSICTEAQPTSEVLPQILPTVVIGVEAEAAVIGKGKTCGKDLVFAKARAGSADVVDRREAGAAIVVGKSKT